MLFQTEALLQHLITSNHERSLEAARRYELSSAVRRQHRLHNLRKRTPRRRWFAVRRLA